MTWYPNVSLKVWLVIHPGLYPMLDQLKCPHCHMFPILHPFVHKNKIGIHSSSCCQDFGNCIEIQRQPVPDVRWKERYYKKRGIKQPKLKQKW